MKLAGKCFIITGANQGLGFEIAKQFVSEGAHLMICARDTKKLEEAQRLLQKQAGANTKVLAKTTDISKPEAVNSLIAETVSHLGKIDGLIANAAIHGAKGPLDEIDWQEWSDAIDINVKGTVFTCRAVLPFLKKQGHGKIIILSGGGATKPMPYLSAYAASKAAVVRFAETLAEEVKKFGIDVNAVAPGALNTRLLDDVVNAGPERVGTKLYEQALKQKQDGGESLTAGANLCVFLASSLSDGITGKLLSAVWDPWSDLPQYIDELKSSDIYTLRRIIPSDRGKTWGDVS